MGTRGSNFVLTASTVISKCPTFLPTSQVIDCRTHITQSPPNKDKKELPLLQVPGRSGRYFGPWQRRWRGKPPGAMLYNTNVEAESNEAESGADRHHLELGLLSQQQLHNEGQESLTWEELRTDLSAGESVDQINSFHTQVSTNGRDGVDESRVNGDICVPSRERFWKGNKQYPQNAGVPVGSVSEADGNQGSYQAHRTKGGLPDHHFTEPNIGPEDRNPREELQEAKVKEIAGCILAIKRLKLACTRTISRTLRNFKGTLKDDKRTPAGTVMVDKTEAEARTSDGSTGESEKPSASKRDEELDEIPWDVLKRLWENPGFVKFRVSVSMANLTMALPTFLSRALPLLSSTPLKGFSFPVLAPLLFGGGIVFKSAVSNLGFVLPRMLMSMGIMWVLWALNHVIQEAIQHLKDNGSFDRRVASVLVLFFELTFSAIAVVTVLSSIGLNVNSLLLPSFLALALAGKDVWQNYFAGFFLFAAQPFRPGHTVALMCGLETRGPQTTNLRVLKSGWFEGVCEAVDLRYTVLRNGRHRLMVPNAIFVKREFFIIDPEPQESESSKKHQSPRAKPKQRPNKIDSRNKVPFPPTSSHNMASQTDKDLHVADGTGSRALSTSPRGNMNGTVRLTSTNSGFGPEKHGQER